ncbi:hypothetical protein EJ07DRAFT_183379 [Lizonia empirigonia]|nr:hypothetical protein EJ07DRAFT_183379 [Lizonia empirigonia]
MAAFDHDTLRALVNETIDKIVRKDPSLSLFVEPKKMGPVTVLQLYADRGTEPVCIGGVGFVPLYEQRTTDAKVLEYTKNWLPSTLRIRKTGYMNIPAFDLHAGTWKTSFFLWQNSTLQDYPANRQGLTDRRAVKEELVKAFEDNVHAFMPRPIVATPATATPAVATPAVATPAVATPAVATRIVSHYGQWTLNTAANRYYRAVYYTDEGSAAEAACLKILQAKIQMRLYAMETIKERLPPELSDMILDYLPFELALALDSLSKGRRCLRRLRRDPIAHRFERAFEVLEHDPRTFDRAHRQIELAPKMSVQFVSIGGRWYLQHMAPAATQTGSDQRLAGRTRQLLFKHTMNRTPYVAVQVDDFGITHIALDSEAGQPQWISPNKVDKQPTFFQDSSTDKRFDSIAVILDGLKLCAVDIPSQVKQNRTRAILPSGYGGYFWSLSPHNSLYVRPDVFDLTRARGTYAWIPPRLGVPGFRLSSTPQPGFNELTFESEARARTVRLVSVPSSPVVSMLFQLHDEIDTTIDTTTEVVPNVVGVWQFDFAHNVVTKPPIAVREA